MRYYEISGIRNAARLAAKLRRHDYFAMSEGGDTVYAAGEQRPWAICNGYTTHVFTVRQIGQKHAPQRLRVQIPATVY